MELVYGNLWEYNADPVKKHWIGITTNCTVRNDVNVMGSGCAKEAKDLYPKFPADVAAMLKLYGNQVYLFPDYGMFTFPTKGDWWNDSPMPLVEESAIQLAAIASEAPEDIFVLPRPGVGAGKLPWLAVLRVIEAILPNNVHVITFAAAQANV